MAATFGVAWCAALGAAVFGGWLLWAGVASGRFSMGRVIAVLGLWALSLAVLVLDCLACSLRALG